ncbi:hypothetical protein PTSG_12017 [Salpingoeca rosetta]|uniref:Uncharacterized protein n=1 Tax=Salpingoeca rosetta (strain ATCC 50818 / BSB-021) TaxID=946362 RepID=F2U526_SALR5|nr:uncharacterized protein PTSG_12017 [Salpingoeca rosetta]EGD82742.1 hypothetical protein PTSG_12017 [Salpingoeca rosetta]|eukprot:XP_004995978.1 hypothetical protein PTSG_12017 [Salpingoeca rosetta]
MSVPSARAVAWLRQQVRAPVPSMARSLRLSSSTAAATAATAPPFQSCMTCQARRRLVTTTSRHDPASTMFLRPRTTGSAAAAAADASWTPVNGAASSAGSHRYCRNPHAHHMHAMGGAGALVQPASTQHHAITHHVSSSHNHNNHQRRQAHSQQQEVEVGDDLLHLFRSQQTRFQYQQQQQQHEYAVGNESQGWHRQELARLRRPKQLRLSSELYTHAADVLRAAGIDLSNSDFDHAAPILQPILAMPAERMQAVLRFFSDPTFGCPGKWLEHLLAKHPEALAAFDPDVAASNLRFAKEIDLKCFPSLVHDVPRRMTSQEDLKDFFDAFEELGLSYETTKTVLVPSAQRSLFGYSRSPRQFIDRLAALRRYFGSDLLEPTLAQQPQLILLSLQTLVARLAILSIAGVYQHAIQNPSSPVMRGLLSLLCTGVKDFVAKTGIPETEYQQVLGIARRIIRSRHPDIQEMIDEMDFTPTFKTPSVQPL